MTVLQTLSESSSLASARAEIARLEGVVEVLMNKIERDMNAHDSDFALLRTTLALEGLVQQRTRELELALLENERIIRKLEDAHGQLLQSEKLACIGQLAAGVAHEINTPIAFVSSNLSALSGHATNLLNALTRYEEALLRADAGAGIVKDVRENLDLDYVCGDIAALIGESADGAERVHTIVRSLRDFAREDNGDWERADIHAGIEGTIKVVWSELKHKAEVIREFGDIPEVECRISQLNQVFMNLLVNAAQAIDGRGRITIRTSCDGDKVLVAISDTGNGMPPEVVSRIFDPFYTTKPVGKGTGLGLSLSYGIIEKHNGQIDVTSTVGVGTTFTVAVPIRHASTAADAAPDRRMSDRQLIV